MMESRLYEVLKNFKGARGTEDSLNEEFKNIAETVFYSGHFLVNSCSEDEYKIVITCIEFYYHEDEGKIKDLKKYLKGKDEYGYPIGSICPNPSGVDVIFDDPEKKYHASFLIRGYQAVEKDNTIYENNKKSRTWNTQDFWYDLFGGANMLNKGRFSIEWVDNGEDYSTIANSYTMERINLNDGKLWAYTKAKLV